MNIKTFMALAVVALTAACSPSAETQTVSEAAGPEADAALSAADAAETEATNEDVSAPEFEVVEPALGENEKPK